MIIKLLLHEETMFLVRVFHSALLNYSHFILFMLSLVHWALLTLWKRRQHPMPLTFLRTNWPINTIKVTILLVMLLRSFQLLHLLNQALMLFELTHLLLVRNLSLGLKESPRELKVLVLNLLAHFFPLLYIQRPRPIIQYRPFYNFSLLSLVVVHFHS